MCPSAAEPAKQAPREMVAMIGMTAWVATPTALQTSCNGGREVGSGIINFQPGGLELSLSASFSVSLCLTPLKGERTSWGRHFGERGAIACCFFSIFATTTAAGQSLEGASLALVIIAPAVMLRSELLALP